MTTESKNGILSIIVGAAFFYVVIRVFGKKETAVKQPDITDANIQIGLDAYKDAIAQGEDAATLKELNAELSRKYGLTVTYRASDGKYIVKNLSDQNIKVE